MTEPGDRVDLTAPPPPEDPRDGAELLARASDGDSTAWEKLIRRYSRLVCSTVASFRLQPADAEEAMQNTWLRVMERMDTIRDPERLGDWLATTASRECLALLRRRHREVPEDVAGTQLIAPEEEPDPTVVAGEAHPAVDTAVAELTECRQRLIQLLFYQPDASYAQMSQTTGMPQGSIGPTRQRALRELRDTLEQRGFGPQSGADVAEDVKGEPTEGDRTGSYLLDNLLTKAEQALREKLEPTVRDFRTGSTQGTGDAQLDDLLHKADAALRAALHDHGTTASGYLSVEEDDRDDRIALLPTDRLQEGTRTQVDAIAYQVGDPAEALPGRVEESWESEPSELDEARQPTRSGGMHTAGKPRMAAPTTPPPSGDRPPLLSRTAWSTAACVAVALSTAGTLVFLGQSWRQNTGTIQVLVLGVLLLACLGLLLKATWTIQALQPKLRQQAEERRRLNKEWRAVRTVRRHQGECPHCARPLSKQDGVIR